MSFFITNPEGEGIPCGLCSEAQNANAGCTAKTVGDAIIKQEIIPEVAKETTVWDVYNSEAKKVDSELVKDWMASLNFLLVFAAIFAVVLTAFIIESKKLLEPDQTEILVDIAIQYFNSMGDPLRTNLTRPDFEPTSAAISINCCLFASLGASLVAALASVVALQWVADYDAAITRGGSSPEDRAKRRQFRHAGVLRWKMGEIIAALPLLLYSSVTLFWAGAIQWMWELHHTVGYVVAGGTAIAVLFYASTTLLGAIYVSSPFRTPLSRGLYWLPRWLLSLLGRFLLWVPIGGILRFFTWPHRSPQGTLSSVNTSAPVVVGEEKNVRGGLASPLQLDAKVDLARYRPGDRPPQNVLFHPGITSLALPQPPSTATLRAAPNAVTTWARKHLLIKDASRHREDEAAKQDPAFQQDALAWLAEQLPISADSYTRLNLFVSGMLALPLGSPLSPRFLETPWFAILEFFSSHYMKMILDPVVSVEDCEGLDLFLQLARHPCIRATAICGAAYELDPRNDTYWNQCTGRSYFLVPQPVEIAPVTFLLGRDVPIPTLGSKYELETTFKLIRWRNSTDLLNYRPGVGTWSETFSDIERFSPEFFESCLRRFQRFLTRKLGDKINYFELKMHGILHRVVEQALSRALTIGEALALAQTFAQAITHNAPSSNAVDTEIPIPHPLWYGEGLAVESQAPTSHQKITLLFARVAASLPKDKWPHWSRWIVMMLWIGSPKEPRYWKSLQQYRGGAFNGEDTNLWGNFDMTVGGLPARSPHIEQILCLLATMREASDSDQIDDSLWINSTDPDRKLIQIMRILDAFDKMMVTESGLELHRSLVSLICKDMFLSGIRWQDPHTSSQSGCWPLKESG